MKMFLVAVLAYIAAMGLIYLIDVSLEDIVKAIYCLCIAIFAVIVYSHSTKIGS